MNIARFSYVKTVIANVFINFSYMNSVSIGRSTIFRVYRAYKAII